jgi:hypothetical protein
MAAILRRGEKVAEHGSGALPGELALVTPARLAGYATARAVTAASRRRSRSMNPSTPVLEWLEADSLEVASAEAPFAVGGCPFQAWSLGELLRLQQVC